MALVPPPRHEVVIAAVPSIGRAVGVERPSEAGSTQDLYERYSGQILGFCVNQLGSRDDAEDAVQSTFLNAHRALQRGVEPEAELAWLYKIAHNVCLTRKRSSWRRGRVESPSDLGAVQDVLPAPSRESADELIRLTDALSHMPDNQRRAILLREWQGLSYHEIAEELELSQSAVETLIFRARRTLAANLEVEPERPSMLERARKALDVGTILLAVRSLFEGGAAVKVAAAAVAASGAAVVATAPPERPAPKPAVPPAVVQTVERPQASVPTLPSWESAAAPVASAAEPVRERRAARPAPQATATPSAPQAAPDPAVPTAPAPSPAAEQPPALPGAAPAPAPAATPTAAPRPAPAQERNEERPKPEPKRAEPAPPAPQQGQGRVAPPGRSETKEPPPGQLKKLDPVPPAAPLAADTAVALPVPVPPAVEQPAQGAANGNGVGHGRGRGPGK